jgi:hypothetical protein
MYWFPGSTESAAKTIEAKMDAASHILSKFQVVGWELGGRLVIGKELTSSASYKYLNAIPDHPDWTHHAPPR